MNLFPDGWSIQPVNEVCAEVVDCINKTAPVVDYPTGYKMIRTTNVRHGRIDLSDCRYADEATFAKWTRRVRPRRNDIVLTREAPLGEVGLLRSDEDVFLGQRTMLYRAMPTKLCQHFLYYAMQSSFVQGQIRGQGSGATVEHLRVPDAEALLVPTAPLPEQEKIAAILTAYDDLIANNLRRIALLESMAEEIYREWFVRMRFPGKSAEAGSALPTAWEWKPIDSLAAMIKRGVSPVYDETAKALVVNQKCIRNNRFSLREARCHATEVQRDRILRFGDVLVNSTGVGTLGRSAVFDAKTAGITCDSHVTIVRPADVDVDGEFLAYTLHALQTYFEGMASGSTGQAELGRDFIAKTKVLVPPRELRSHFADVNKPIRAQRRVLLEQVEQLTAARNALLPRLISGKLRVDYLDIQFPPSMQDFA